LSGRNRKWARSDPYQSANEKLRALQSTLATFDGLSVTVDNLEVIEQIVLQSELSLTEMLLPDVLGSSIRRERCPAQKFFLTMKAILEAPALSTVGSYKKIHPVSI
jgi:hypothetical protein